LTTRDNAAVESFFATLKRELAWIHHNHKWSTRAELRAALFDYIEAFYNTQRIQRRLDHRSPLDFENHAVVSATLPRHPPTRSVSMPKLP